MPLQPNVMDSMLTLEAIDKFRNYLSRRGLSDNTVLAYYKDARTFLDSAGGSISAADFDHCATYWLRITRKTLSPATTTRRLSSLRAFAKWAQLPNTLENYRAPRAVKPNPHPLPGGIPDVRRMIAATENSEHQVLVALCGLAGTRIAEALAVRPEHIDTEERMLTIVGKGEKTRRVPLSVECWDVLEWRYLCSLITGDRVVTIGDRSARQMITRLGKRSGIMRRVASHDLRATFATHIFNQTKNIRIVQELLGHSSVAITEIYLGLDKDALRDAVEAM